jgi:hypothetical protein
MRRGAEAIEAANEAASSGGGTFTPFLSSIFWGGDGDERTILILNPMEEIPQVDFHPFIEVGDGRPHSVIVRTDPLIGESVDPIQKTWLYKPRLTNLAVALELEVVTEEDAKGREKPVGFRAATRTFERTILDDDGKPTDEKEEVTVPCVGIVAQSPINFFNQLRMIDASEAEINTLPIKVTRVGKKDVSYNFKTYENIKPDLTDLFEFIGDVSYLGDQAEPLMERLASIEDDTDAAAEIGRVLLDLYIDEKADDEAYEELFNQITEPSRFPEKSSKGAKKEKAERPARQSQRRARTEPVEETDEAPEETPVARRRSADESTSKASARQERLARLQARQAKAAAASGE